MRIVLLGPPGAGKGTQGELLAKKFSLPRLSVGALIRRHSDEKTELGEKAEKYMTQGLGIPADILMQMLAMWFKDNKDGFIIDNLIRTEEQLREFKKFQKSTNFKIDEVIYLDIPLEEAISRLDKRKRETIRPDEDEKAMYKRFITFYESINPILDYFKQQGVLVEVNGNQSIEKVFEEIISKIKI